MRNLIETVKAARRVSTPLLAVQSPDQQAVVARLVDGIGTGAGNGVAMIQWDCVQGLRALNGPGAAALGKLGSAEDLKDQSPRPDSALALLVKLPDEALVACYNMHRFINEPQVAQAVCSLRDAFKANRRTLVMLAPMFTLPTELQTDVVLLEDGLPTDAELASVLTKLHEDAELPAPIDQPMLRAVDAVRGLSAFGAEQVAAMSLTPEGLSMDELWARKEAAINQTKGLQITRRGFSFDDLGGLTSAIGFGKRLFLGRRPPRAVMFLDEIEKSLAGAQGDLSGIAQDQLGVLLRTMEDEGWDGMIAVGPPGSGKTAFGRALGASHGVPTLTCDLGATKGSLVGESEQGMRTLVKTVLGVGGDRVFVVATCNKLESLPPELRRRFRSGIWFFDLPTAEERAAIWRINLRLAGLPEDAPRPDDGDWTGAEIRNVCAKAAELDITLTEASAWIVPVARADAGSIERLRALADGRFLSASAPGPYARNASVPATTVAPVMPGATGRKLKLN